MTTDRPMTALEKIQQWPKETTAATPDQDLSARLAEFAKSDCRDNEFAKWCQTAWQAYATGQLITLADHERAVQAAVSDALDRTRTQDERGLKDGLLITVLQHSLDMMDAVAKAVEAEREACAWTATSFLVGDPKNDIPLRSPSPHEVAAAIRSRGVAG